MVFLFSSNARRVENYLPCASQPNAKVERNQPNDRCENNVYSIGTPNPTLLSEEQKVQLLFSFSCVCINMCVVMCANMCVNLCLLMCVVVCLNSIRNTSGLIILLINFQEVHSLWLARLSCFIAAIRYKYFDG